MSEAEQAAPTGVQRAPLNKVWVIKIVVITVLLLGFGAYGLYDATVAYPRRGEYYAENREWTYLLALKDAEREEPGIFLRTASVPDPKTEHEKLTDPGTLAQIRENAQNPSSTVTLRSNARLQRLDWLDALRTIGQMKPERTTIELPQTRLNDLNQQWATRNPPKGLAFYDIPSQWIIMAVCWAFALWLIFLLLRTSARRYTWDPKELRLTTPAGSFHAGELAEVDKRKWDKFIVYLRLMEGHAMGSKEMKFDTYRHAKLEEWILAMEEARFGPQQEPGSDGESGAPENAETEARAEKPSDAESSDTEEPKDA